MATSENGSTAPRSPKRALVGLDGQQGSPSKRSRPATASPAARKDRTPTRGDKVAPPTATATTEQEKGANTAPGDEANQEKPTVAPPQEPSDEAPEVRPAPKTKMCGVCHEKEGKYKCTRCALPFCSIPCNKLHRENHPPDPEPKPKPPVISKPPPEQTTQILGDPRNPFRALENSEQLRYLFKRYPSLQGRLLQILQATEPPPEAQGTGNSLNDLMKARAMAAANPKKETWTHDVGIRNGKEALRKARNATGEDGEGVREYIELINHLVSKANDAEVEEALRRETARKDTELIRRLMEEDRG